jgi:hypothetical protein
MSGKLALGPRVTSVAGFRGSTWQTVAFVAILLAALGLRLLWLDADAATTLSWSGAVFTDEGLYSHAARNRILFGAWRLDGWDNRLASPLHDLLAFALFRALGVGYAQLRLGSVALACAALLLFWRLLRRDFGASIALAGALLWALDYYWFQFSRLALLEPGMVCWLVGAAYCWRKALDRGPRWAVLAGLAASGAWIWKSLALVWLPAPFIALALMGQYDGHGPAPSRIRLAASYAGGLALGLLAYALAWYLPHAAELGAYSRFYAADRVPASFGAAVGALGANLRSRYIWAQSPVILVAALPGLAFATRAAVRRALPPVAALCLAWTLCGSALLIMPYSPPRYYTLLLPPLIGMLAYGVSLADNLFSPRYARLLIGGVLAASLLWSGLWYGRWVAHLQRSLPETSRALARLVPPDALVFGISSCALSLENTLRCVPPIIGLANERDPEQLGADYVLVESNPADFTRRSYGALLRRSELVATLPFGAERVQLYRLPDQ